MPGERRSKNFFSNRKRGKINELEKERRRIYPGNRICL
jgi:hypothetical protein